MLSLSTSFRTSSAYSDLPITNERAAANIIPVSYTHLYSYRMVPYILADNPNFGADNAITLSRKMMDGNKFALFVLELSFLGWFLLGLLAFGVGILFVSPYVYATEAQLYLVLRDTAIDQGYCTAEDLNLYNDFVKHDGYYWEE